MKITGIICEYNPFHLGHHKQLTQLRQQDPEGAIVCLMSGNFVQRGEPAVFHKSVRAAAAITCGADLVLELPVTACLSSAEGFAAEGVRILSGFCDQLSFGAETADSEVLMKTASVLLTPQFSEQLKQELSHGISFPAARQRALEAMGCSASHLSQPNNILATEYCKAILSQQSKLIPVPILRQGSYHDSVPDPENPSATSLRLRMEKDASWLDYTPTPEHFRQASIHTLQAGEKAILYRLRTMTDEDFMQLPYGSEGLWRKLMKNAHSCASLEQILTSTKSKRYTRSRLDRMVMCAFLGITQEQLAAPAPYVRVLGFNDRGRKVLLEARKSGHFLNLGENSRQPFQQLEDRCDSLYGLFATHDTEPPAPADRIYYTPSSD